MPHTDPAIRHETLDPTPIARAIGWSRPPTLQDQIRRLVAGELSRRAAAAGAESFDEADDFDVDGDPDPHSPWELTADNEAEPVPSDLAREKLADAIKKQREKPVEKEAPNGAPSGPS